MAENTRGQNVSHSKERSHPNEVNQKTGLGRESGRPMPDANDNSSNRRGEMRSRLFARRNFDDSYFDGQLSDE